MRATRKLDTTSKDSALFEFGDVFLWEKKCQLETCRKRWTLIIKWREKSFLVWLVEGVMVL